jgi:hypothetical protein
VTQPPRKSNLGKESLRSSPRQISRSSRSWTSSLTMRAVAEHRVSGSRLYARQTILLWLPTSRSPRGTRLDSNWTSFCTEAGESGSATEQCARTQAKAQKSARSTTWKFWRSALSQWDKKRKFGESFQLPAIFNFRRSKTCCRRSPPFGGPVDKPSNNQLEGREEEEREGSLPLLPPAHSRANPSLLGYAPNLLDCDYLGVVLVPGKRGSPSL